MIKKLLLLFLLATAPVAIEAKHWSNKTDFQCMIANLYFEARGEGIEGMKAVAKVTMNRVKSKRYPSTICAVIFQRKQFSWTHQQKWKTIDKIMQGKVEKLRGKDLQAYKNAVIIASAAVNNKLHIRKLEGSMFYHANYVSPKWARKMQKVAIVGTHVFYRG
jgi:spore germination cell wall hydrolase CwlJ-like protein